MQSESSQMLMRAFFFWTYVGDPCPTRNLIWHCKGMPIMQPLCQCCRGQEASGASNDAELWKGCAAGDYGCVLVLQGGGHDNTSPQPGMT